ncbi:GNAT family N-acetyltransferase [Acetobacterium fimetarium]|uniref:GNAT family N-acetyltransferase n=1 Tax=Acetobacterium fimetarium TaxID=52691 RepID=A0ABR6WX81_9FIRM|nr:GNAT family N-acetyltransferase [Acetobacterium fimetarium]MBC3805232.1 GNAT family N-acetyltransferase [Acetobacterium fimetarium]
MKIIKAGKADLENILALQYLAYQSEARLLNNYEIQPLTQKLEEVFREFEKGTFYQAVNEKNKLIGSVRGFVDKDTLYIGKLIVHPDYQGNGIGTALLKEIEKDNFGLRQELFTSDKSLKNLKLYERTGFVQFKTKPLTDDLNLVFMEKQPRPLGQ